MLTDTHVYCAVTALRAAARNRFVKNDIYTRIRAVIYQSPVGDDLEWRDQDRVVEFALMVARKHIPKRWPDSRRAVEFLLIRAADNLEARLNA